MGAGTGRALLGGGGQPPGQPRQQPVRAGEPPGPARLALLTLVCRVQVSLGLLLGRVSHVVLPWGRRGQVPHSLLPGQEERREPPHS